MGRDIYAYIERRRPNDGKWECLADDRKVMEDFSLYRYSPLFAVLSYNEYEGEEGVKQKPFKDWISTISPQTFENLFFLIDPPITDFPSLYCEDYIKSLGFYECLPRDLDNEEEVYIVKHDNAIRWLEGKESFLLTDNIISNADACYINWCSADELEWAVMEMYRQEGLTLNRDDDEYLKLVSFMREHEANGYEVRMVYAYDNSTPWLTQDNSPSEKEPEEEKEEEKEGEKPANNRLLMYLLQNRAQDFINIIEGEGNHCFFGMLSLYQFVYANKLLLADNDWNPDFLPTIEHLREENEQMLRYLESIIKVPSDYPKIFMEEIKPFSWYDEDDIEFMLDGTLDELVAKGYREIDCRLYAAAFAFNFNKMIDLLNQGANPYAHISGDYSAEEAALMDTSEVNMLEDDAATQIFDACDLEGICACWKDGVKDKETIVGQRLIGAFLQATGYQIVVNIVKEHASKCDSQS